ncbi:MAG: hypothetical protein ATN32_09700 [Candidatus Epulonipiscium fishelsonii]|nr:MAG: hypothetical protein ATN32_09700 [Epulopiscium sp. AS2M-Bin002]
MNSRKIINIIIGLSILALVTLGGFIYSGIRYMQKDQISSIPGPIYSTQTNKEEETTKISVSKDMIGPVTQKGMDTIEIYNIEEGVETLVWINEGTKILNQYNNHIPFASIDEGQIVNISFDPINKKANRISIQEGTWSNIIEGHDLDKNQGIVMIGKNVYKFNGNTVLIGMDGKRMFSLDDIGDFDSLFIQGINKQIYSIKVQSKQGYIKLMDMPSNRGRLEIDRTRQILLKDVAKSELIPVEAGTHNLALYIDSYEPILVPDVQINSGQTFSLNGTAAELKRYNLQIIPTVKGCTITVDDIEYDPGDEISLIAGNYDIRVEAPGYNLYEQKIQIEQDTILRPSLIKNTPAEEKEIEKAEAAKAEENAIYTFSINSIPEGAKIFINGEYKGVTPMRFTLNKGTYHLELEKEGFYKYTTTLLVEKEDAKEDYSYILAPE